MFITINMNHWRAVKAWVDAHHGQASLDMSTFVLEIRARNRYYTLYPQFLAEVQGRRSHVTALTAQATSFIGWRPYKPVQCALSSDKLVFKQAIGAVGLSTPAHWLSAAEAQADFVLKRSFGSFGYQLAGPFRRGQVLPKDLPAALTSEKMPGRIYAEAFVAGRNLKVWFWDGRPVHAQCQPYGRVVGDGRQTVQALVRQRLEDCGESWDRYAERGAILGSLAYQRLEGSTVLEAGREAWLDYRYGRSFVAPAVTEAEDNAWQRLPPSVREQIQRAGEWLAGAVRREVKPPVLFSVDGVLDDAGRVWWLELNSNPICPPNAYFAMLATLFGTPSDAPANAFARTVRAQSRAPTRAPSAPSSAAIAAATKAAASAAPRAAPEAEAEPSVSPA
jgi:hypothetical protein